MDVKLIRDTKSNIRKFDIIFLVVLVIAFPYSGVAKASESQTFVLLVHGYSITGTEGYDQWQMVLKFISN